MSDVLTRRDLNRATLARQLLLARAEVTVADAVGRLLAMQAQEPRPPFTGLWARVADFTADDLRTALRDRTVVRATWVRATLHLLPAADYVRFRSLLAPTLAAGAAQTIKRLPGDIPDLDELIAAAREVLGDGPLDFAAIRDRLAERFPKANDRALGYQVRLCLPLVMVPTDDPWAFPSAAQFGLAETLLDQHLHTTAEAEEFTRRYLAAYGPATAADMQTWSWLPEAKATLDTLRPELAVFRDESGKELFDLPDAPRPDGDVPAPARFLPDFDSLLLAHADRTRIIPEEHRTKLVTKNLRVTAAVLHDGIACGTWKITRKKTAATLTITPFTTLPKRAVAELTEEGERLLAFTDPEPPKREIVVA